MLDCVSAAAQNDMTTYSGKVTDTAGKAVGNVTCKLLDGKDSLLAYALTRRDGTYRLKAVNGGRQIEFAFLGSDTKHGAYSSKKAVPCMTHDWSARP